MAEAAKPAPAKPKKEESKSGMFWSFLGTVSLLFLIMHGCADTRVYPLVRPGTPNTIYGWDYPDDIGNHSAYITAEWSPKVNLGITEGKKLTFDTPGRNTRVTVLVNEDDADGGLERDLPTRRDIEEGRAEKLILPKIKTIRFRLRPDVSSQADIEYSIVRSTFQ